MTSADAADVRGTLLKELPLDEYRSFTEHLQRDDTKPVRGSTFEFGLDLILKAWKGSGPGSQVSRFRRGVG
jgi:hypothetical protein